MCVRLHGLQLCRRICRADTAYSCCCYSKVELFSCTPRRRTERDAASHFFDLIEVTNQFQVPAALYQGKDLAVACLRVGLDVLDKKEA